MTALLTDNLPLLAGAPSGIKKLRELILELAVRGKLVPQDPNDESASELLKRIAEEKARLVAEGKIKKQKPLAEILETEKSFGLPASWVWTRLGEICLTQTGTTPSKSQPELFGSEVPFIKPGDIYPDQVDYNGEGLSSLGATQNVRIAQPGSLLMVCIGTIGKCNLIERACSFNQQINSATLYEGLPEYLRIAARSAYFQSKAWSESSSTTIAILNKGKWEAIPLPLPCIAEQHRIVAKVDELMALCDHLEAQQADAESAHAQLVQALLDSLTQASDADEFATNWQRLAEHFHTLFTTESSIDALKQTLLQLAVMGKLVPQDPSDEPASELLKRIAEEKARLVAEGKIRKPKRQTEIKDENRFFIQPSGWETVRFAQVIELISGQHLGPDEYFESTKAAAIPYLTGPAEFGETHPRPTRFTNERRATSVKGDILLTVKGSGVGKTNFVDQDELAISRQLMAIRPIIIDAQFTRNMLLSMSAHFQSKSIGIAIPGISREDVLDTLIGVPPIGEQHRIVAKVDQLVAICDQLKACLIQARQLNEQLASTLVEQAVA
jgi:type I restriction enzyme S subunit